MVVPPPLRDGATVDRGWGTARPSGWIRRYGRRMANDKMRDHWTTGAEGWVTHRDLFDAELAPFARAVLDAADIQAGQQVLDIGCGTGILLAAAAAAEAHGTGVDISPVMVDAARTLVPDATFVVADAQVDDLTALGPFDTVISRFGVMFFEDPIAAFANIRSATRSDGRLAFACWRSTEENAMFTLGTTMLMERMDPPRPPLPPRSPGPDAFAEREWIDEILTTSGWSDLAIEPFDAICAYGPPEGDGVEERLTMILSTMGGRIAQQQLEPRLGPEGWAGLLDEVRAELRRHLVDGRVQFTGATWLVTARNPG